MKLLRLLGSLADLFVMGVVAVLVFIAKGILIGLAFFLETLVSMVFPGEQDESEKHE